MKLIDAMRADLAQHTAKERKIVKRWWAWAATTTLIELSLTADRPPKEPLPKKVGEMMVRRLRLPDWRERPMEELFELYRAAAR